MIYPTKWPCNYFPCARTILAGRSSWNISTPKKWIVYFKHHFWFEVKYAAKSVYGSIRYASK